MEIPAKRSELHLFVIEAHLLQDRSMKVAVIVRVLYSLVAVLVCRTVDGGTL